MPPPSSCRPELTRGIHHLLLYPGISLMLLLGELQSISMYSPLNLAYASLLGKYEVLLTLCFREGGGDSIRVNICVLRCSRGSSIAPPTAGRRWLGPATLGLCQMGRDSAPASLRLSSRVSGCFRKCRPLNGEPGSLRPLLL
eukprot:scaffold153348_cov28-Tisochrysis_lutea.AAC.1